MPGTQAWGFWAPDITLWTNICPIRLRPLAYRLLTIVILLTKDTSDPHKLKGIAGVSTTEGTYSCSKPL